MSFPDVLSILKNLPPGFWETGIGAIVITLLVQNFKKFLNWLQVDHKEWIYVLLSSTLSFLASLGQYVQAGGGQEWTVLGQHTAVVLGAIQLVYHFPKIGVKSLSQIAQDAKVGHAVRNSTSTSDAATTPVSASPTPTIDPLDTPKVNPNGTLDDEF